MEKIKRFINVSVPVDRCNLRCPYCYITLGGKWNAALPQFQYSAEHVGTCFSKERLGGTCYINICGTGETLMPPDIVGYIGEILKQGHFVMIITNATLIKRVEALMKLPKHDLKRLGFKLSFHYLELKKRNLMDAFLKSYETIKAHGCSYSIEMTPSDDLIPYIDEVYAFCMEHFGAPCHLTVARDSSTPALKLLTKLSPKEYYETWLRFGSEMFEFKMTVYGQKRTEYCYAGDWSLWVDLGSGFCNQCYGALDKRDILKDPSKKIDFFAIGKHCRVPFCHNAHALMCLGVIPDYVCPTYAVMRNKSTPDGNWLNSDMYEFFDHKLIENNEIYTFKSKLVSEFKRYFYLFLHILSNVREKMRKV